MPLSASPKAGRIGLVVNPIAGMGGRVGLMGTDGCERLRRSIDLGARPTTAARVHIALSELTAVVPKCTIVAAPGAMGATLAAGLGFDCEAIDLPLRSRTVAQDTRQAAAEIAGRGVDLLLFAGGDGTARDVLAAVGERAVVLGIPTGVKMHSGVFASSPHSAGRLAAELLSSSRRNRSLMAEVVDREEQPDGTYGPVRLYGELRVPGRSARLLTAKAAGTGADAGVRALQETIVEEMLPGRFYILGPGGTVGGVRAALGLAARPLAVSVVRDRQLIAEDASEADLLALLTPGSEATIIIGVIGGQGSLLGRGNQPLSPAVLRRVGMESLMVVASTEKLMALRPARLHVDTGDPDLDRELNGFRPVRVAPHRTLLLEVTS